MTTNIEVMINGELYIKADPKVSAKDRSLIESVLSAEIDYEKGKGTVRSYLHDLLSTLWREDEGFSGKSPFGNSGWEYDLYKALGKASMIQIEIDEDGYIWNIAEEEKKKANRLIFQAIDYVFFGSKDDQ